MPITSHQAQPSTARSAAPPPSDATAGVEGTTSAGPVPRTVGVVFVHGIGSQGPAETFLDWSRPIVTMLRAWRSGEGHPGDPVISSEFSFSPAAPPLLELAIPPSGDLPAGRWLVTEAWWAADLRAPALGSVLPYLRSRLARVVAGIAAGYRGRQDTWRERRGEPEPARWAWINRLDRIQARTFSLGLLVVPLTLLGSAVLAAYGVLRAIPIGPIRDFAELRVADSFIVDWFGDLPVLLDDAVQVANVRTRIVDAIDRVRNAGADAVVLVAHSGGAIVSFETLLDPAYLDRPVDKLVTLGQGLSLAWRLESDPRRGVPSGDRLLGDLAAVRPALRWVDVWASYDPAPAGPLRPIPGVPLEVLTPRIADAAHATPRPTRAPLVVENRAVTNRMNVLADHGAYWDNDEGFLVPLVRHLDAARGVAGDSRFYRDPGLRGDRIERRRERVAVLAAWDWLCSLGAAFAVVVLAVAALAGLPDALRSAGDGFAAVAQIVPGHQLVTGPVDAYGRAVGGLADAVGVDGLADALGALGAPLMGTVLVAALFLTLGSRGNGRWDAWDRTERAGTRAETPTWRSRRPVAGEAIALVTGLAALWLAVVGTPFGLPWPIVAAIAVGGWLVGLGVRSSGGPRNAPLASQRRRTSPGADA